MTRASYATPEVQISRSGIPESKGVDSSKLSALPLKGLEPQLSPPPS